MVTWEQEASDRLRFTLHLADDPFGLLLGPLERHPA
jgi:hypothetical protein